MELKSVISRGVQTSSVVHPDVMFSVVMTTRLKAAIRTSRCSGVVETTGALQSVVRQGIPIAVRIED